MKTFAVMALAALVGTSAAAQGRVRLGPTISSISIEDASGTAHAFTSFGASAGLITGDDGEVGLSIARYHDLSVDGCPRALTLYALDEYYYPVGPRGLAPYASTEVGLARVTQVSSALGGCGGLLGSTPTTSSEIAIAFGLGVRVNLGDR